MQKVHNTTLTQDIRRKLRKNLTEPEKIFWNKVRAGQAIYKFRRQHSIGPYVVDFYCPQARLIVEIDGDSHAEDGQAAKDEQRNLYFKKLNFRIKRYCNRDIVNNIEGVLEDLYKILTTPPILPLTKGRDREL